MSREQELEKKISEYERRMGIGDDDPAKDAYLVYVTQLRERTAFLKGFKLSEKIGNAVKDDPVYARAIDLIDSLPKMISSVTTLRIELKMDGEKAKNTYTPISSKAIANGEV